MVQNNSSNENFINNSDGFSIAGGTTQRSLSVTSGNISMTGGNGYTYTLPGATDTIVGRASIDTLTNKTLSGVTLADGTNVVTGITTGSMIGTATTQKLGFFGTAPAVQQAATTDLGTVLSGLGLRAAGTAYPLTTSGAVNLSGVATLSGATTTISSATTTLSGAATTISGALASTASVRSNATVVTAAVTLNLTTSTEYQFCTSAAAYTITLPTTTVPGYRFTIKKTDSNTTVITIAGKIDSATNYTLAAVNKYITLVSSSTSGQWYNVASN